MVVGSKKIAHCFRLIPRLEPISGSHLPTCFTSHVLRHKLGSKMRRKGAQVLGCMPRQWRLQSRDKVLRHEDEALRPVIESRPYCAGVPRRQRLRFRANGHGVQQGQKTMRGGAAEFSHQQQRKTY